MAEIGSVIDGKYEILTEIGHGGMSVVYLAMDTHLNKQWAVKEIKKKGSGKNDEIVVNSLLAEANMMKRLDHPSLPRIVDIIDNGITIYVVMDYIEGESLDKILAEYGAQPEELVIGWAKQLCDALSYLHSQKPPIIYRDMKPANVMLKPEGNIKIIDFGIAREYKEQSLADTTVLGTKGYAPPEQYSGQTDARSDIYALGMTMHHLLTGIDPRTGEAYAPVRMWNPEVSEGMEMIIDKCVQPAAEHRYQNCQDLLYDLEHPELITRDYKRKQKRKLNCFITSVILAVVMVISGVVCNIVSTRMNNSDYETLISTSTASSLDDKINNYKNAVEIYPGRTEAYVKMIEAYQDEGTFSKQENDDFLAVYNANKDQLDATSSDVSELNYIIGMLYFNYYTENNDGDYSFSTRVQKAYPFFNENYQSATGFEEQTIASLGNVKDYRVTTRNDNINFRYNKDKWYKGYSFTWSNIKRNILHDMGRTATTGKFKDGSFKIKLTSSDKVSKYSVYFKDKKFELGKLTFNFSKETYSIPEKLVKFFNVTKTTDNTMNFLKNVDGLYDFYTESDKSFGGSIKALKNVTGIGKNSKAFSIFDKYGTKTVKTIEDVVGLIGG